MHIHPTSVRLHLIVTYLYVNVSDASVIFTAAKQQATPGRVSTVMLIYTIHDNNSNSFIIVYHYFLFYYFFSYFYMHV